MFTGCVFEASCFVLWLGRLVGWSSCCLRACVPGTVVLRSACSVTLLFAPAVVYICFAGWFPNGFVCLRLCLSSGVCLRGSCVALLYESPGGNQVDGLPPALHT